MPRGRVFFLMRARLTRIRITLVGLWGFRVRLRAQDVVGSGKCGAYFSTIRTLREVGGLGAFIPVVKDLIRPL